MKQRYLNKTILSIFILIIILLSSFATYANTTEEFTKILTEISIDIKYIKNNIVNLNTETQGIKKDIGELGTRVTVVEERQINIKEDVCDVNAKNTWFMGIIGSLMVLSLGVQIKRSKNHRKEDCGEENTKDN